jgi:hypothetical protein
MLAHESRNDGTWVLASERVLVRVTPAVAGIEGQPVRFSATLENVAAQPQKVLVTVAGGLTGASVRPDRVQLAPGQALPVTLTGTPSGERIRLRVRGSFGVRRVETSLRQIAARELLGPLPPALLEFVHEFAAVGLQHRSGTAVADPAARSGRTWLAQRGQTDPSPIVYGPYAPMPAGRYLALFRLKRTGPGHGIIATLDSSVQGGRRVTASRPVTAEELPESEYRSLPLLIEHPGGEIETRILWPGTASLAVDSIILWQAHPAGSPPASTQSPTPPGSAPE